MVPSEQRYLRYNYKTAIYPNILKILSSTTGIGAQSNSMYTVCLNHWPIRYKNLRFLAKSNSWLVTCWQDMSAQFSARSVCNQDRSLIFTFIRVKYTYKIASSKKGSGKAKNKISRTKMWVEKPSKINVRRLRQYLRQTP